MHRAAKTRCFKAETHTTTQLVAHGICWEPPIRLWRVAQPCWSRSFGSNEHIFGSHQLNCGVCPRTREMQKFIQFSQQSNLKTGVKYKNSSSFKTSYRISVFSNTTTGHSLTVFRLTVSFTNILVSQQQKQGSPMFLRLLQLFLLLPHFLHFN